MAAVVRRHIVCWVCMLGVMLPTVPRAAASSYPPPPIPRALRDIMRAFFNWEATFRWTLLSETGGLEARSWRVEILRMLELDAIRKEYDHAKPWNSPANQNVLAQRPEVFEPSALPAEAYAYLGVPAPGETTRFVAIVDPVTAWQPGQGFDLRRIEDGTANTIVLIEAPELGVLWTEPRDATLSEAIALLGSPVHRYSDHFFYVREWVSEFRYVALADGHVEEVAMLNPQAATAYLTSAGNDAHLVTAAYNGPWRRPAANVAITHVKWDRVIMAATAVVIGMGIVAFRVRRRRAQYEEAWIRRRHPDLLSQS